MTVINAASGASGWLTWGRYRSEMEPHRRGRPWNQRNDPKGKEFSGAASSDCSIQQEAERPAEPSAEPFAEPLGERVETSPVEPSEDSAAGQAEAGAGWEEWPQTLGLMLVLTPALLPPQQEEPSSPVRLLSPPAAPESCHEVEVRRSAARGAVPASTIAVFLDAWWYACNRSCCSR